jgi:hypothetical protein
MVQLVFLLTCPLLIATGTAVLSWNALKSPWKYMVSATLVLYVLYAGALYFFAPVSLGFAVSAVPPGQPGTSEPLFPFLEPYYKSLVVFAVFAIPAVAALLLSFKRGHSRQAR